MVVLLLGTRVGVAAQLLVTQEEALQLAFPGATAIERHTAFLEEDQLGRVAAQAGRGVDVRQGIVTYYVGKIGTRVLGAAYFDSHRVRTLPEVLMIVVLPDGTVERVELLQFSEPPEYRPPGGWLELFEGKKLDAGLALRRDIPNMSGASLTSDAVTDAVRRVLALHAAIRPFAPGSRGTDR